MFLQQASYTPSFGGLGLRSILEVTGFDSDEAEDKVALAKEILAISKTLLILDNLETVSDTGLDNFLQDMPLPSKVLGDNADANRR